MAKETFYFSHDYNARSDRKMINLLMTCGMEGIGIYWCIVEMLYEEGGYLMRTECERIAFELRTECERITKVIDSSLFCHDEDKFWSESVLSRLQARKEKSQSARNSALKMWDNKNAMRSHSDGNAIKESKGKENKIKAVFFENDFAVFADGSKQPLNENQIKKLASKRIMPHEVEKITA